MLLNYDGGATAKAAWVGSDEERASSRNCFIVGFGSNKQVWMPYAGQHHDIHPCGCRQGCLLVRYPIVVLRLVTPHTGHCMRKIYGHGSTLRCRCCRPDHHVTCNTASRHSQVFLNTRPLCCDQKGNCLSKVGSSLGQRT